MNLLKPRVMALVIFTGAVGMYLAPGQLHPLRYLVALICLSVAAGASGALNMWLEVSVDRQMQRTRNRPLVRGVISPDEAAALGVAMGVLSVLTMGLGVNWVAAAWLLCSILFYVIVYTLYLKPRTDQNIVIGGAAGALPPVVGWASVTGQTPLESWVLFLIIFMWTPPHFWTLSLWCARDYARADIPMLPNIAGYHETRRQIGVYGALVTLVSLFPIGLDMVGLIYAVSVFFMNIVWMRQCMKVYLYQAVKEQKKLFAVSIFYLFFLFLLFVIDRIGAHYGLS